MCEKNHNCRCNGECLKKGLSGCPVAHTTGAPTFERPNNTAREALKSLELQQQLYDLASGQDKTVLVTKGSALANAIINAGRKTLPNSAMSKAWKEFAQATTLQGLRLQDVFAAGYEAGTKQPASASISDPERDFIIAGHQELINDLIIALKPFEGILVSMTCWPVNKAEDAGKLLAVIKRAKSIT